MIRICRPEISTLIRPKTPQKPQILAISPIFQRGPRCRETGGVGVIVGHLAHGLPPPT
jgi:hypothetical protein